MLQGNLRIFQSLRCFILCIWKSLERHPAWNWPLEGGIACLLVNIVLLELLGDVAVAVVVLIHTLLQLIWLILETQQRGWEVCLCSWKQWYTQFGGDESCGKYWPGSAHARTHTHTIFNSFDSSQSQIKESKTSLQNLKWPVWAGQCHFCLAWKTIFSWSLILH